MSETGFVFAVLFKRPGETLSCERFTHWDDAESLYGELAASGIPAIIENDVGLCVRPEIRPEWADGWC